MRFVPSQPDSQSPTWETAFGLFSFQIGAVLISSLTVAMIRGDPSWSIIMSGALTVLAAFLYAQLSESEVPGAMRQPRFRMRLAARTAFMTGMVAFLPMVVFRLVEVKFSGLTRNDLYVAAFLVWGLFVVPWLELWLGLTLASWLRRWRSRS